MPQITPSPVHPMSAEEWLWITGRLPNDKLAPIEYRYYEIEDDLPFEWECQHSCSHGTECCQKAEQAGCVVLACVAICSLIVAGAALAAAWRALG